MLYFNLVGYSPIPEFASQQEAIAYFKDQTNLSELTVKVGDLKYTFYRHKNNRITEVEHSKQVKSFQDIFGTKKGLQGTLINKILLAFWELRFKRDHSGNASGIQNLNELYKLVLEFLDCCTPQTPIIPNRPVFGTPLQPWDYEQIRVTNENRWYPVQILLKNISYTFYTRKYTTADIGSATAIRSTIHFNDPRFIIVNDTKSKKRVAVKASKILLDALQTSNLVIGEKATIYCAECFQAEWQAYVQSMLDNVEVVVDKSFNKIYSSIYCTESFGSCMTDKKHYTFYEKFPNAYAAYLIDKSVDKIVARCILWKDVTLQDDDNLHSYADRTYSSSNKSFYKNILITKLIEGGHIDLYKEIGAGCRDYSAVYNKEGKRLANPKLSIPCTISLDDTISFCDTFAFYDIDNHTAYNYEPHPRPAHLYFLSTTAPHL